MESDMTSHTCFGTCLRGQAALKALARAANEGAAVRLQASDGPAQINLAGSLTAQSEDRLTLRLTELSAIVREILLSSELDVTVETVRTRYGFQTRCTGSIPDGDTALVEVAYPVDIAIAERRRATRRRLQKTSTVTLRPAGTDEDWECKGSVLNVSTDGIACRFAAQAVSEIGIDDIVHVAFSIGSGRGSFNLTSRVSNKTPAGTRASVLLGMEFVHSEVDSAVRAQLENALTDSFELLELGTDHERHPNDH